MISRQALKRPGPADPAGKSWGERARAVIARVDAGLPETASLAERQVAVDAAYPFERRAHYPYKVWCRERRRYLARFGYVPEGTARTVSRNSKEGCSDDQD